ncbi:parasitic phase-specific protein PSP-1 [Meredithblackwellia eburnea MCA 4105]
MEASLVRRDQQLKFNIYGYDPSLAAAIVFLVSFALLTLAHIFLVIRSRSYWYSICAVGGICECIGWIGRLLSAQNFRSLDAFLTQQICLVLAPNFYSAALYACLGLLVKALGDAYSRLSPRWYLITFCMADLAAMIVQAVGGGMAATALGHGKASATGTHTMVAGIAFQLLSMLVFSALGLEYVYKVRKSSAENRARLEKYRWFIWGIGVGSFWILVRCVYRTVELSQGWQGYLITHQPYFLCLDSVPMVITMAVLIPTHPYLSIRDREEAQIHKTIPEKTEDFSP